MSINTDDTSTSADIVDYSNVIAGDVIVSATDQDTIIAVAGALFYGGEAGIGASISLNTISPAASSSIENSDVTALSGPIDVTASGDESIEAITAALGAADSGMAVAGAYSQNTISGADIDATVSGSTLIAVAAIVVSASRRRDYRGPGWRVDLYRRRLRLRRFPGHQRYRRF